LTTQIGTKNDQKLEKETVPKIPQKDTEKNSPNNKNSKDPKQFEEEKELENIQSTSTTTIDCSDKSLQNLENQKNLKENEVSNTEDKNDENFEEKVEETLIINEQMDGKESSKEEEVQVNTDRKVKKIFKNFVWLTIRLEKGAGLRRDLEQKSGLSRSRLFVISHTTLPVCFLHENIF